MWIKGTIIEVLDSVGHWEPASIIRISGQSIYVHYVNWSSKWDEWLNVDADKYKLRLLGAALVESEQERLTKQAEQDFRKGIQDKFGYEVVNMTADGNCLFRGFAHQIYFDQDRHMEVREMCLDYLTREKETFEMFIADDFQHYVNKMRSEKTWGGHIEIAVMREMFNVNVEIFHSNNKIIEPKPIGGAEV